ncbi:hypothetical protein QYE76_014143 [Lolium multiflorum]|uniref:RNase H type-1 domain-containing protein n=1 Tax=Lolium multiflorum TaxID=4521 RepID=A0AAD8U066_LOLMU|nr:hypothetical protein QYE76_014143 [Lolium multiflorum]
MLAPPPKLKQAMAPGWLAPPAGVTKVNVDAALSKNGSIAAVAAVARDAAGTFLGASAVASRGITDPETMEALACREGLALATDLNLQRLRLASDCANVVRAIKADAASWPRRIRPSTGGEPPLAADARANHWPNDGQSLGQMLQGWVDFLCMMGV